MVERPQPYAPQLHGVMELSMVEYRPKNLRALAVATLLSSATFVAGVVLIWP